MMQVEFTRRDTNSFRAEVAVGVLIFEGKVFSEDASQIDELTGGAIARALQNDRFSGESEEVLELVVPQGLNTSRLLLLGSGRKRPEDYLAIEEVAALAYKTVQKSGATVLELRFSGLSAEQAAHAALGAVLAAYRFDKYRTIKKSKDEPSIARIRIAVDDVEAAQRAYTALAPLADAVYFARDLVSEPPNVLYPVEFAARVKALEKLGLSVEVLSEDQMATLKMDALLGVGQGSERESQLVVIQWNGGAEKGAPLAFIGKGVCFDSGGITLKAGSGMESMKWDMGGAAAVVGLMMALARRKAKVNAVGILALVENMPDGNAQRPADIVTSMSGQTIEIISTDSEGRLILADALWYCQERFNPRLMIDLATLTGAVKVALGTEYAGLFSNDDVLAEMLVVASEKEGERLWRLPMPRKQEKAIESTIADMKNHIDNSFGGAAITGALFIQRFINNYPWAHLDIANVAWKSPSTVPMVPEGASGYGIRLLNRFVADNYEGTEPTEVRS